MRSKKIIIIILTSLFLCGCGNKTYTINFDTLGGSIIDSVVIEAGERIEDIIPPTKEGYLFVNWLKDGVEYNINSPITEDITLTANWIETPKLPNTYTVTYIIEGTEDKEVVKENTTVNEPKAPLKENYIFIGWYLGEDKFDFNTKITKDITLVAKYELNTVKVTYDLSGGAGIISRTITKNTQLSIIDVPVKKGYKFLKWTLNGQEFSFETKITEDITLKAVWEKIDYVTVNFDTDGGAIINSKTIEKYSKLTDLPIPTKEGYTFVEWQLDNNKFTSDTIVEKDITLKAIYE